MLEGRASHRAERGRLGNGQHTDGGDSERAPERSYKRGFGLKFIKMPLAKHASLLKARRGKGLGRKKESARLREGPSKNCVGEPKRSGGADWIYEQRRGSGRSRGVRTLPAVVRGQSSGGGKM